MILGDLVAKIIGEDQFGNKYHVNGDRNIEMTYPSGEKRGIGKLQIQNGELQYLKREDEAQRFNKINGWSINWHVAQHVEFIYYHTEEDTYKISVSDAKLHGFTPDQVGVKIAEPKIYVSIKDWITKSDYEKERNTNSI